MVTKPFVSRSRGYPRKRKFNGTEKATEVKSNNADITPSTHDNHSVRSGASGDFSTAGESVSSGVSVPALKPHANPDVDSNSASLQFFWRVIDFEYILDAMDINTISESVELFWNTETSKNLHILQHMFRIPDVSPSVDENSLNRHELYNHLEKNYFCDAKFEGHSFEDFLGMCLYANFSDEENVWYICMSNHPLHHIIRPSYLTYNIVETLVGEHIVIFRQLKNNSCHDFSEWGYLVKKIDIHGKKDLYGFVKLTFKNTLQMKADAINAADQSGSSNEKAGIPPTSIHSQPAATTSQSPGTPLEERANPKGPLSTDATNITSEATSIEITEKAAEIAPETAVSPNDTHNPTEATSIDITGNAAEITNETVEHSQPAATTSQSTGTPLVERANPKGKGNNKGGKNKGGKNKNKG